MGTLWVNYGHYTVYRVKTGSHLVGLSSQTYSAGGGEGVNKE